MDYNFDIVSPDWINKELKKHNLKQKDISHYFGNSDADISAYCNGKKPLSKIRKSAFYYFFIALDLEKQLSK